MTQQNSDNNQGITTVSKKIVIGNNWTTIVEENFKTKSGSERNYVIVERQPALMVIPVIKNNNNVYTYLVKQYRYPIAKEVWQFPMGTLDQKSDPVAHAKKELLEETGLRANKMIFVGSYFIDPGLSRQECFVYIAEEVIEGGQQELEETEIGMITQKFTVDELKDLITDNKLIDGWIYPGYFYLNQYLHKMS